MRKTFNTAVGALNKVCNLLLGIDMAAMFLVLLLQIFSRFVAFMPLPWSQDLIVFLLVVSVFLGAGSATANGKQIRLEVFADALPKAIQNVVFLAADLISIVFLAIVLKQSFSLAQENMTVVMGASPVAFGWYYAAVTFGAVVMILNFAKLILDRIASMTHKNTEEEESK